VAEMTIKLGDIAIWIISLRLFVQGVENQELRAKNQEKSKGRSNPPNFNMKIAFCYFILILGS
jgi:hypothetical protein